MHEQSRPDRDSYVRIIWDNIKDGLESQFRLATGSLTYDVPYDGLSVMHYGNYYFSKNGKRTIASKV